MATFSARIKLAMNRIGMGTTKEAEPAATLYHAWLTKYQPTGPDHVDTISRQVFHKWLRSHDKIPSISAHHALRLGDLLNVAPRWLIHGVHMGNISMEPFKALSAEELKLVEYYRRISTTTGRERVLDRAKDIAEDSVAPQ